MKNPLEEFWTDMINAIEGITFTVSGWIAFKFGRMVYRIRKNKIINNETGKKKGNKKRAA